MNVDMVLEFICFLILAGLTIFLRREGSKRRDVSRRGWTLIYSGFLLLLLGSVLDVADEFEPIGRFVVTQAFLEKMIGFAGGFFLITLGLVRWIPTVRRVERNEAALRKSHLDLQTLAGKLISAHEEERRRIARDLHDDLTQRLAALAIETGKLERESALRAPGPVAARIRDLRGEIARLAEDVQSLSRQLHPSILEDLGLVDAVASECDRFSEREGIEVQFTSGALPSELPRETALCLYRVTQEGLRNIAKHSGARQVDVSLQTARESVRLCIRDSGVGFSRAQVRGHGGLGLASMEERIRLIRGDITIDSRPGEGTVLLVSAPLTRMAAPPRREEMAAVHP